MPALNLSVPHGQPWEAAQANFEKGISQAGKTWRLWIRRVEWSEDRRTARLTGPGYDVSLRLDATHVHVEGHLPVPPSLLEQPMKKFLRDAFGDPEAGKDLKA